LQKSTWLSTGFSVAKLAVVWASTRPRHSATQD